MTSIVMMSKHDGTPLRKRVQRRATSYVEVSICLTFPLRLRQATGLVCQSPVAQLPPARLS